jgi:cell division septation protein DedD
MKNKILITLFLCVVFSSKMLAQVTINEDPVISQMMSTYTSVNKNERTYEGFRIQIAATPDRQQAESVLGNFKSRYAGVAADWVQQRPYYKVKVGAFLNRNDAQNFLKTIKKDFPDAYLVSDKIKASEIGN